MDAVASKATPEERAALYQKLVHSLEVGDREQAAELHQAMGGAEGRVPALIP